MKTKIYQLMLLAAVFAMAGLTACEKDFQEFGLESENITLKTSGQVANEAPVTYGFWAGQRINVGSLEVSNDEEFLYITYKTSGNWWLKATHLHVATSLDGIPSNRRGIPVPGQFQYKNSHDPMVQEFTYIIPNIWNDDQKLVIAAHAEVILLGQNGRATREETGFGGDNPGPGPRWWFYAEYEIGTGINIPGDGKEPGTGDDFVFDSCKTAWAIDSIGELYFNGYFVDGVFIREVNQYGDFTYPLLALNENNEEIVIGSINIYYDHLKSESYFEIAVHDPYVLSQANFFLALDLPETIGHEDFIIIDLPENQKVVRISFDDQVFAHVDFDWGIWFVAIEIEFCPRKNLKHSFK